MRQEDPQKKLSELAHDAISSQQRKNYGRGNNIKMRG